MKYDVYVDGTCRHQFRIMNKKIKIFGYSFWKEKADVISESMTWCCSYGCYLHVHESLWGLLREVVREHRHDRHMVG
jgi:hypothetical protein